MYKTLLLLLLSLTLLSAQNKDNMSLTKLDLEKAIQINKFYKKNLQKTCGRTAPNFAQMYTRNEWLAMKQEHTFIIEISKICPRSQNKIISIIEKDGRRRFQDLYSYSLKYAKDSGLYPPS